MPQAVVRPSMKLIRAGYTLVFLIIFLWVMLWANSEKMQNLPSWIPLVPVILLIIPIRRHVRRHFIKMTLDEGKLKHETGVFSRSIRHLQISKIQDVRVDQTLAQRLLGTGDLSIETAGETSLLTMRNVDEPLEVASMILKAASDASKGKRG